MTSPLTSTSVSRPAAREAVMRLAPGAAHVCRGSLLEADAVVAFELDTHESTRRERAGVGAITDVDVLDLLLDLPYGVPVRIAALGRRGRRALAKAPAGCVEVVSGSVIRRSRPPLTPSLAIITGCRSFRHGLERAGRFAPFCPKAILLDRRPKDVTTFCMEADFYGVGLIVVSGASNVEVLVPPEPRRSGRLVSRTWWFAEEVYRVHLASDDHQPVPGSARV